MKRLQITFALGLLAVPLLCAGRVAAQQTPREVAQGFYRLVVSEQPAGLPGAQEMPLFDPYLSRGLRALFARAARERDEAVRRRPDEKPPFVDGSLFSCAFEGPRRFSLGRPKVSGRFAYVPVKQDAGPGENVEWTDTLVLVKEGGRWLVWDVRMGCKWSFRMGPTLRAMLGGK